MTREKMKPKYDLDDYILDVESRSLEPSADPEDIYAQLQQKEKDLILAAELGKALLEKNEELSRANERLAEDYSNKLEVIEQDRHTLRRKLATTQAECETRMIELQADIRELQRTLSEKDVAMRQSEKDKNAFILELTEQNQRLTAQLKESSKMEEQLRIQLQSLKEQAYNRRTSMQDHQSSLDVLRDEIIMMTEKKNELERRVQSLTQQREGLSATLEEASDRIMLLERQLREQQIQMRVNSSELEELKNANGNLGERLQSMGPINGHRSLHSEMECDDSLLPEGDDFHQFKIEIVNVYDRVRAVCHSLKQRAQQPVESVRPDISVHEVKVGLLTSIIQELCDLVSDLSGDSFSSSSVSVTDLEIELHRAQESLDKMAKEMEAKSEELKRRGETIMELTAKLSVRETELECVKEERDQAKIDLKEGGTQEELIRRAWEVRDSAVARKNATQVELARTRIDVMQANSQLMEAIQQKIELSQQLEQWQMDMQALLDEQMRKKLANPEQPSSGSSSPATAEKKRASRRLFGIFQSLE
ncbi:Coiled-coil domain-containing protein [Nesidiocoris tenuis]|uniref:Coiled-coil domain-containing protein n=2 Tax=Nesidiocoris tenuis TaxID=355587 RepID=A0ABN7A9A1_9HEMI|nr:Coiled-coil domain-containing protein [Nesidiocoris tenuis]